MAMVLDAQPDVAPVPDAQPDVAPVSDAQPDVVLVPDGQSDVAPAIDAQPDAAPVEPPPPCPEMFPFDSNPRMPLEEIDRAQQTNEVLIASMRRIQGELDMVLAEDQTPEVAAPLARARQVLVDVIHPLLGIDLMWPCHLVMECLEDNERVELLAGFFDLAEHLASAHQAGLAEAAAWNACVSSGTSFRARVWVFRPVAFCGIADSAPHADDLVSFADTWDDGAVVERAAFCPIVALYNACVVFHIRVDGPDGERIPLDPLPRPVECGPPD